MAFIDSWKRADGSKGWTARVFIGRGDGDKQHRIKRSFDTERNARAWAAKMELDHAAGEVVPTTKLRTGEFLDR
jgi:hypothetical protein